MSKLYLAFESVARARNAREAGLQISARWALRMAAEYRLAHVRFAGGK